MMFFISVSNFLFSQSDIFNSEYEVIYSIRMLSDTLQPENVMQENSSLLISNNRSLFKSTKKAIRDSVAMAIGKKSFGNPVDGKVILDMRNVPAVNFKSEVFLDGGKQTVYKELLKNSFAYPLEDTVIWKIEDETKTVAAYLCRKATGRYKNRNYTAWFAEKIAIPDGPYVFKGLPGLVLEVYDTNNYVNFSMVSFKKVSKPIILIKDSIKTDFLTFTKARRNYLDNPSGTFTNQTGISLNPAVVSRVNANSNRFNNYID
nr:GLPGLI family protein [uncultured Chryseobacterium sp.]